MAAEVLARQAQIRAEQTGEAFEVVLKAVLKTEPADSLRSYATDRTATRGRTNGSLTFRESGPRSVGEPDERRAAEPNSPLGSRS